MFSYKVSSLWGVGGAALASTLRDLPEEGYFSAINLITYSNRKQSLKKFLSEPTPHKNMYFRQRIEQYLKSIAQRETLQGDSQFWFFPEIGSEGRLHWHGLIYHETQWNRHVFNEKLYQYCKRTFGKSNFTNLIYNMDAWIKYITKDCDKHPMRPTLVEIKQVKAGPKGDE